MDRFSVFTLLRLLSLVLVGVTPSALLGSSSAWRIDTLEATVRVGMLSLAIDSSDVLHASFRDDAKVRLHYGTYSAGTWTTEGVPDTGTFGGYNSIAVTPDGDPLISHIGQGRLRFARKAGGSWVIDVADTLESARYLTSIGADSKGQPHICYFVPPDFGGQIKYATKQAGSWLIEYVNATGGALQSGSIAIDSRERPHIAYCGDYDWKYYRSKLKYAVRAGAAWQSENADTTRPIQDAIHLALGSEDQPHIVFTQYSDYDAWFTLYYETKIGEMWVRDYLDDVSWFDGWIISYDIALDREGNPHLIYVKGRSFPSETILFYASKADGSWTFEIVAGNVGSSSLVLDSYGVPHILFSPIGFQEGLFLASRDVATSLPAGDRDASSLFLTISPNPIRAGTALVRFLVPPGSGTVTLGVYDVRGRLVESLLSEAVQGGEHSVTWNGLNSSGRPVGSGVYFLRLSAGARSEARRFALFR